MGFPESIAEKALLDCSRCCCICHKFCGFKIELHHIVQKAQAGADTYENCIPLCLDCHAEVKAYDPKHPKGRKYTESELKQHRDKWYEKARSETLVVIHPDCVELDRKLFLQIRELLPGKRGSIYFIRNHIYTDPFLFEKHDDLRQYRLHCEEPDFEFIDANLEMHKSQLKDSVKKFLEILSEVTFTVHDSKIAVYPEIKHTKPKIYYGAIEKVHDTANEICSAYDDLVRLGRRKLAVE
jgi:HNH endonuclease